MDMFNSIFGGGGGFSFEREVDLGSLFGEGGGMSGMRFPGFPGFPGFGGGFPGMPGGIRIAVHTFRPGERIPQSAPPEVDLNKLHEYMEECGIDVDEELDRARSFGAENIDDLLESVRSLRSQLHSNGNGNGNNSGKKNKKKEGKRERILKDRPEDVVYEINVSLKDVYLMHKKEVEYLIFKGGKEVKRKVTIPIQGRTVLLKALAIKSMATSIAETSSSISNPERKRVWSALMNMIF